MTYANWFGGRDPVDPHNFYAQFAVDAPTYLPMYTRDVEIIAGDPPQVPVALPPGLDPKLASFLSERDACLVGERLFKRMKWKLGQRVPVSGTIYPGTWEFTIRSIYHAKDPAFGEENMLFHWKYLSEKGMGGQGTVGWYVLELSDPSQAGAVAHQVDAIYESSAAPTRTETERAFQAGFVSTTVTLLDRRDQHRGGLRSVMAAKTMMAARAHEIGVMRLGLKMALSPRESWRRPRSSPGETIGLGRKWLIRGSGFNAGGVLPPATVVPRTVVIGIGTGADGRDEWPAAGLAGSRLNIVDARAWIRRAMAICSSANGGTWSISRLPQFRPAGRYPARSRKPSVGTPRSF